MFTCLGILPSTEDTMERETDPSITESPGYRSKVSYSA